MTVVDMSQQLPGPYASALLGQLGATVTKVEPLSGDPSRRLDPDMFHIVNRGKTSVRLDLKTNGGVAQLHDLVREADVFIEGFRPGVAARLGASYSDLARVNPRLVYCSISGVGQEGPFATVPMHDLNLQAWPEPIPDPGSVSLGWTWEREQSRLWPSSQRGIARTVTKTGVFLDAAMLDTAVAWNRVKASAKDRTEPTYGIYATADGRRIAVAILEDHIWARLCTALGWDDWSHDPALVTYAQRVSDASRIERRLTASCASLALESLMALAREHDLPITPMDDGHEPLITAQLDSRRYDSGTARMPLPLGSEALE